MLPKLHRFTVDVSTAMRSALSDVASLSKADMRAEKLVEYCIYQYFGCLEAIPTQDVLGYGVDKSYLSDDELESYLNDEAFLNQAVTRLMELLDYHLSPLKNVGGMPIKVHVSGLTAIIHFT